MLEYILQSSLVSYGIGFTSLILVWFLYTSKNRSTPPGPIAYPIIGNLDVFLSNGGNILKTFRQLRSQYGDLFSLKMGSYDAVVVNGYETIQKLLVKRGEDVSERPNSFLFKEIFKNQGLVGSSGLIWKTHRTFALKTLRNFGFGKRSIESRIMEEVAVFIQDVASNDGKPFDFADLVQASVSNIICSIVFGQRFEQTDKRFTKLLHLSNTNFRLAGSTAVLSLFPFLRYVPGDPCKGQLILNNSGKIREWIREIVEEHRATYDEDNLRDYIDVYLKEQKQNRETFTDPQLFRSISDLFAAGTETTSSALKWAILHLIHNSNVQTKMRKELDDVIGTSRPPSLNDKDRLPFCEAVITEVLRQSNITPLGGQHSCNHDVLFGGYTIKKDTIIIPNLDSVLKDPNVFENPEVFDPERFIDDNGKFKKQEKVIAFSIGRRVCLGESLARSEIFLFLTSMIQRFEIVAKDENSLPPLDGKLGITYCPNPYEFRAIKRM